MSETEWLDAAEPGQLAPLIRGRGSPRKWRLFSCACCRRVPEIAGDETLARQLDLIEQAAEIGDEEGLPPKPPRLGSGGLAEQFATLAVESASAPDDGDPLLAAAVLRAAANAAATVSVAAGRGAKAARAAELFEQCGLFRCVFGNLVRPALVDPAWLAWDGGTMVRIARACYDDRAFDRLPVLADALEEAGCTDATILAHCREPGVHARGCWVLDLLLGKT